jgi:hypothetical protein
MNHTNKMLTLTMTETAINKDIDSLDAERRITTDIKQSLFTYFY